MDLLLRLVLAPLLAAQALWVIAHALRLPEASGPRSGTAGTGRPLRVLIAGDSSAAGVGAPTQDQALAGQLVARLGQHHAVIWRLEARTGDTTRSALRRIAGVQPGTFDIAIVALGVNDSTRFVPARVWSAQQRRLIALLRARFGVAHIYLCAVPPLGAFPLLPQPLRWVLGRHAQRLDATLTSIVRSDPTLSRVDMTFDLDASHMAPDGFHPGPAVHSAWAQRLATMIHAEQGRR